MSNKLLVVIVSDDAKAIVGVRMASRMVERGSLDDVRVLFFGPSERLLADPPEPIRDALGTLRRQAAPMACRFVAQEMQIAQPLEQAGTELVAAGEEIERRMLEGYQLMTF
ncbi:MAG: hypothetical protein M0Z49_14500 [Chloroflexi bacterium]|nr:hypothetical protein [Chloroflexota bacterium]